MVKKYYVITIGAEVGVFYDHWLVLSAQALMNGWVMGWN